MLFGTIDEKLFVSSLKNLITRIDSVCKKEETPNSMRQSVKNENGVSDFKRGRKMREIAVMWYQLQKLIERQSTCSRRNKFSYLVSAPSLFSLITFDFRHFSYRFMICLACLSRERKHFFGT